MYVVFEIGNELKVINKNSSVYLDLSATMEPVFEGTQKECNKYVDDNEEYED